MKELVIAWNSLRRLFRDRTNIFFVFLMPLLLILVLGASFGGTYIPRVGMVDKGSGVLGLELAERIGAIDGIELSSYADAAELTLAVERGRLDAGVVIPEGFDDALRDSREVAVEFIASPDAGAQALRNTIESAITEHGLSLRAATFAAEQTGADFSAALTEAEELAGQTAGLTVQQETIGEPFAFDALGQFDLGAYSQLLLFVFITSTTGSTALIQSRQLGVSQRMLSTPTSVRTILVGELLGRFAVALFQGLLIIGGTALLFGVNWGDPLGATAVFMLFALGSAGVGMLMGAVFKNDQQAGAVGVILGLGFAALGGSMIPLTIMRIFSPTLYNIAHITPHAWGIGAFEQLTMHDATIGDILPQLGVLAGFAIVMIALGAWRLRAALTRG